MLQNKSYSDFTHGFLCTRQLVVGFKERLGIYRLAKRLLVSQE
jgi:hypothetical protein